MSNNSMTSEPTTPNHIQQTLFAGGFPVSQSQIVDTAKGSQRLHNLVCGTNSIESFAYYSRDTSSWKTCHQRDRIWIIAYPKGSEGNGNETIEKYGKARTQEIFRDRNGGKNTYTWRNTPHELKGNWREWSIKPVICRDPNGVPSRVDRAKRLKALGNSIVPQVAAIPLKRVLDLANAAQGI